MTHYTIIVVVALIVIGYVADRLIRMVARQSDYIMAVENERSYQLSKPVSINKKLDESARRKMQKRAEVNMLYDTALSRGEIDDDTFKVLQEAQTEG